MKELLITIIIYIISVGITYWILWNTHKNVVNAYAEKPRQIVMAKLMGYSIFITSFTVPLISIYLLYASLKDTNDVHCLTLKKIKWKTF